MILTLLYQLILPRKIDSDLLANQVMDVITGKIPSDSPVEDIISNTGISYGKYTTGNNTP
jgi:hypothetical protein